MKIQITVFFFIFFTLSLVGQTVLPLKKQNIQLVQSTSCENLPSRTSSCGVIAMYEYQNIYRILSGLKASQYTDNNNCYRFNNSRRYLNQQAKTPELRSFSFSNFSL